MTTWPPGHHAEDTRDDQRLAATASAGPPGRRTADHAPEQVPGPRRGPPSAAASSSAPSTARAARSVARVHSHTPASARPPAPLDQRALQRAAAAADADVPPSAPWSRDRDLGRRGRRDPGGAAARERLRRSSEAHARRAAPAGSPARRSRRRCRRAPARGAGAAPAQPADRDHRHGGRAGSLIAAASEHTAIAASGRRSSASVTPATSSPAISASLCPPPTRYSSVSGLHSASQTASAGSAPQRPREPRHAHRRAARGRAARARARASRRARDGRRHAPQARRDRHERRPVGRGGVAPAGRDRRRIARVVPAGERDRRRRVGVQPWCSSAPCAR